MGRFAGQGGARRVVLAPVAKQAR
jgi:hypothetical protein